MLRPAQVAVIYSGGVGGLVGNGQEIVTYAAPSARGAVTYSRIGCGGLEAVTCAASYSVYPGGVGGGL